MRRGETGSVIKKADKTKAEKTVQDAAVEVAAEEVLRDGYLLDYISGKPVKDGPEEREAVQVFAKAIFSKYGY